MARYTSNNIKGACGAFLGLVFFLIAPVGAFADDLLYSAPFPQTGIYSNLVNDVFVSPYCQYFGDTRYGACQYFTSMQFTGIDAYNVSKISVILSEEIGGYEKLSICLTDNNCSGGIVATSEITEIPSIAGTGYTITDDYAETIDFIFDTSSQLSSTTVYYLRFENGVANHVVSPYDNDGNSIPLFSIFGAGQAPFISPTLYFDTIQNNFATSSPAFCAGLTCGITDLSGCFKDAVCWAFVPSTGSIPPWGALGSEISKKPPFGYIGAFNAGLAGVSIDGVTGNFSFMTQNTFDDFDLLFSPLRDGLAWLLWFCGLAWLYNRIKNITV